MLGPWLPGERRRKMFQIYPMPWFELLNEMFPEPWDPDEPSSGQRALEEIRGYRPPPATSLFCARQASRRGGRVKRGLGISPPKQIQLGKQRIGLDRGFARGPTQSRNSLRTSTSAPHSEQGGDHPPGNRAAASEPSDRVARRAILRTDTPLARRDQTSSALSRFRPIGLLRHLRQASGRERPVVTGLPTIPSPGA